MWIGLGIFLTFSAPTAAQQQPAPPSADEQAIRQAARDYLAALARGDAKVLAESWTADGDFIDEQGRTRPASELIAEAGRSVPQGERPEIKLIDTKIRFLSGDVAIEDGTSEVTRAGSSAAPVRGRFAAIWVRQNNRWRLASLREAALPPAGEHGQLSDLQWMVGVWLAETDDTKLEVTARWNTSGTFLLRDLKIIRQDKVVFQGSQRIGWDPIAHRLKSWIFDSDGGYGEGTWTKEGNRFLVQTNGVLPDGRQTSATHAIVYDGKDRFTWTSSSARVHGESAPGLEITFVRTTPPAQ
jgi:uncharacterized protein (TIGR02246 family)